MAGPSDSLQPLQTANAVLLQANDDAAESPRRDLPRPPSSRASPPASRPSDEPIDLTSPAKPLKRAHNQEGLLKSSRPSLTKSRASEDERRLVGDFSTPADAVRVPHPSSWMKTGTKKPGAGLAYQPVNTINNEIPGATRRKTVTYAKDHRLFPPSIGKAPHAGQQAYLQHTQNMASKTPARTSCAQEEYDGISGDASPAKRRKTEHVVHLIEDDEDDRGDMSRPALSTPAGMSYDPSLSARSSQSRLSVGSGSSMPGIQQSQQTSEFQAAGSLVKSCRKKPRRSGSIIQGARQAMFHSFEQGISTRTPEQHQECSSTTDEVKSYHFPNAHINESTAGQTANNRPVASSTTHLRNQHWPVPKHVEVINEIYSSDELAMSDTDQRARTRAKRPSKATQATNSGIRRKVQSKVVSKRWPLVFARTYGYERRVSNHDRIELMLRIGSDGLWRITASEQTEGESKTQFQIKPQDFNKAQADEIRSIRLTGPRRQDGNSEILDLEFADTEDLMTFCDEHAAALTPKGKIIPMLPDAMPKVFAMPLPPRNVKVGTSELVHDPILEAVDHDEKNNKTSRTPMWNQMKRISNSHPIPNESNSSMSAPNIKGASTRSLRSTKPALAYALEDESDDRTVAKFSVDVGLGPTWTKPLEYGQGRQRAVVHFDDLPRLDEEEYMNDALIDFYIIYLSKKLEVPSDKVYFFNTHFFTRLKGKAGRNSMDYKAVERWTSKIDIFSYDYIVVPINELTHWYLAIICNVSNIDRKPVVEDFDQDFAEAFEESIKDSANLAAPKDIQGNDTPQLNSSPNSSPSAKAASKEQQDDDPNLFEESLFLVDREDPGVEVYSQADSVPQSPGVEAAQATQVTADAKSMSQPIVTSAKRKLKRKPIHPKRDPNQPTIIVFDSLVGSSRSGTVRILKDWLAAEGEAKRGMEAVIKENGYYPKSSQIPMQTNWTDCGVYLLGYVEKFFQDPDDFKNKLLSGEMSASKDWPKLKPKDMRTNIREIIFRCYEEQETNRKAEKKGKKGVTKAKTSPTLAQREPTNLESEAPLTVRLGESQKAKLEVFSKPEQSVPQAQPPVEAPRPRLASPFEYDAQFAAPTNHSIPKAVGKVSDSPPVATSPVKSVTPGLNRTTRRGSPEVRVPGTTSQSHTSMRNGQPVSFGMVRHNGDMRQVGSAPRSLSPNKRLRQDKDDQLSFPSSKGYSTRSPRRQGGGRITESSPSITRSREGSAPNVPIEIEDSQDLEVATSLSFRNLQAKSPARQKQPSRTPQLMHSLLVEEMARPSPRRHGQAEELFPDEEPLAKFDEEDQSSTRCRRSEAPMMYERPSPLSRTEEAVNDAMDIDAESVDLMEIDDVAEDTVIKETPEPRRRSPGAQEARQGADALVT